MPVTGKGDFPLQQARIGFATHLYRIRTDRMSLVKQESTQIQHTSFTDWFFNASTTILARAWYIIVG